MDGPYDAVWHGSKEDLLEYLRGLPATMIQGNDEVRQGIADDLLGIFHEAFLQKSQGQEDEAGIKWEHLKPSTLYKKAKRKILRPHGGKNIGAEFSGLKRELARLQKNWKFRNKPKLGRGGRRRKLSRDEKEELRYEIMAVQLMLRKLKQKGAGSLLKQRHEALAGMSPDKDILIETHDLERSLDPKNLGVPHHVFESRVSAQGEIVVGTTEKPWHHTGFKIKNFRRGGKKEFVKGKSYGLAQLRGEEADVHEVEGAVTITEVLPRKYWPTDGTLPDVWWQKILDGVKRRFGQALVGQVMAQEQRSR